MNQYLDDQYTDVLLKLLSIDQLIGEIKHGAGNFTIQMHPHLVKNYDRIVADYNASKFSTEFEMPCFTKL